MELSVPSNVLAGLDMTVYYVKIASNACKDRRNKTISVPPRKKK